MNNSPHTTPHLISEPLTATSYPLTAEIDTLLSHALRRALGTRARYRLRMHEDEALTPQESQRADLCYEVIGDLTQPRPCLVLANGLGGRIYTWLPIIEALAEEMNIITWDYRGLFDSQGERELCDLSVPRHADDLYRILTYHEIKTCHLVGWSMGVQVSLEFTAHHPEMVQSLSLLNGSYGQVFSTAFQPLFRLPLPTRPLHRIVEGLKRYESVTRLGFRSAGLPLELLLKIQEVARIVSRREVDPLLMLAAHQYCNDLCAGEHLNAYLSLFQHLDAHSVYHLLPAIEAPTLVISGGLDFLTPAYQSRELARRLPHARHQRIRLASHFALLERPQFVTREICDHVRSIERA